MGRRRERCRRPVCRASQWRPGPRTPAARICQPAARSGGEVVCLRALTHRASRKCTLESTCDERVSSASPTGASGRAIGRGRLPAFREVQDRVTLPVHVIDDATRPASASRARRRRASKRAAGTSTRAHSTAGGRFMGAARTATHRRRRASARRSSSRRRRPRRPSSTSPPAPAVASASSGDTPRWPSTATTGRSCSLGRWPVLGGMSSQRLSGARRDRPRSSPDADRRTGASSSSRSTWAIRPATATRTADSRGSGSSSARRASAAPARSSACALRVRARPRAPAPTRTNDARDHACAHSAASSSRGSGRPRRRSSRRGGASGPVEPQLDDAALHGVTGDTEEFGGADDVAGPLERFDAEAPLGVFEVEIFKDELRHAGFVARDRGLARIKPG